MRAVGGAECEQGRDGPRIVGGYCGVSRLEAGLGEGGGAHD